MNQLCGISYRGKDDLNKRSAWGLFLGAIRFTVEEKGIGHLK